jgi:hypothetical protein
MLRDEDDHGELLGIHQKCWETLGFGALNAIHTNSINISKLKEPLANIDRKTIADHAVTVGCRIEATLRKDELI